MKLDEYIKKNGYSIPRLSSVYDEYSNVFKEYYKWVNENLVFLTNKENKTGFFCFEDESEKYQNKIRKNKYSYNNYNNLATPENINRVEKSFSTGFRDGFNEVEFKPYLTNNIIDNIVFQDRITDIYFGVGILKRKGHSFKLNRDMLMNEETSYFEGFDEGKRFKSYFLYIENYDQFKKLPEPFLRPMKCFINETKWKYIHFTDNKDFDLHKVQNIDLTDNRLKIVQSKEELIDFFKARLTDWYSDEDIDYFLKANFKCFDDKKAPKILISNKEETRGLQRKFYKWMYEFYLNENYKGDKKLRFAEVLKNNFDVFKNSNLSTISKAMRND